MGIITDDPGTIIRPVSVPNGAPALNGGMYPKMLVVNGRGPENGPEN